MSGRDRYTSPPCEDDDAASTSRETPAAVSDTHQTPATTKQKRKRGRPRRNRVPEEQEGEEAGNDEHEEQTKAKRRLVLRDLVPVDFVGRARGSNEVASRVHELLFINAIWQRKHCRVVSTDDKVRPEILQSVAAHNWVNDTDCRYQLGRWAAPLDQTAQLRSFESDQGTLKIGKDYVGDVMRAFKLTSTGSKPLHIPCASWSPACLPGSECDASYDNFFLDGPDGGIEGSVETTLFRIDRQEDVNIGDVDQDLLTFMYLMALALCKDDNHHIFYAVQTEYTDILTRKNKYVHICNVRQCVASQMDAVKARQVLSAPHNLDEHLKRKLQAYKRQVSEDDMSSLNDAIHSRCGVSSTAFDLDDDVQTTSADELIAPSQHTNVPNLVNKPLSSTEEQAETFTTSGPPCRIFYTVHVVQGLDKNQQPVKYYMQCVTVRGTVIGVEPLVAMRQACNMFDDLRAALLRIATHMCNVMQTQSPDFIDRLFSTGSVFNCVNIFDPVNLLEAIFRRAASDSVSDVHFKGQRLDLTDDEEMSAWGAFKAGIIEERKQYYDKVKQKTDLVLSQRSGFEMAREPDRTFAPIVYTGVHARLVQEEMLDALRQKQVNELMREKWLQFVQENYDSSVEDIEVEEHIAQIKEDFIEQYVNNDEWRVAVEAQLSYENLTHGATVFKVDADMEPESRVWAFPVHGSLNLTGPGTVVFEFNMQAQVAFDKKNGFTTDVLPDSPFMFDPLASIYIEQHMQSEDRFKSYWDDKCVQVPTMEHLLSRDFELPEHLLTMRMQVLDAMAFVAHRGSEAQNLRVTQVEELVGASVRGGRTLREVLDDVNKGAQLGTMMRQRELMLKTWIANERRRMAMSDLRHMAMHLQVVNDLKAQGRDQVKVWTRSANQNNLEIQNAACAQEFGSDSARANEIWCSSIRNLDTGLCTMNLALLLTFINSVVSYFSRNKKTAVGYPILLCDCGMQVTQTEVTPTGMKTSVVQKKSSGAGADLLLLVSTVMLQAYAINVPFSSAVRAYMMRRESQLKNHKRVSQLAWRQIGNVAVWRDEQGRIKSINRNQCSKIGQMAAMTETMKMQSNHDGGGNTFGRAEQAVGNPLQRAVGPQEEAWSTTQNLNQQTLETLYNGIPLFLLAGNRPDGQFPPSALEGGRLKPCFAAVQDHHGTMYINRRGQAPAIQDDSLLMLPPDTVWRCSFIDPDYENTEIKIANKEMTEQNIIMLGAIWCTQPFAFIKAALHLDYEHRVDTLRTQTHSIVQNFMVLSQGLRRGENAGDMNRKKDVYMRVMSEGAFSTVDIPGIHAQQQLLLAFQRRAELPCIDAQGNVFLKLEAAFEDSLLAMLDVPISINTILSSLYLTLSTYLLNVNVMIASCFFLFCARCYAHCPLHVLAAAAHGLDLDAKEERQLHDSFVFFDRLCHCSAEKLRGSTKLVLDGWINRAYSVEDVLTWLDFKQHEDARDDILSYHRHNPTGNNCTRFVLVQEQIFHAPPLSWVSGRGRKNARNFTLKVNSITELKLLFLAEMQKAESHKQRLAEWKAMHNSSLASRSISSFVDTEAFWDTVGKGTRFPQTMRMSTDENDTPHMATQETTNFFASLLHDMSVMHSFIQHVLQYFRLPQNTSRLQLLQTVFARYRTNSRLAHPSVHHVFPSSPDWKQPILADISESYEPFRVELRPHVLEPQQSAAQPAGVHAILGVDVLWLLLSQIYNGSWVQKSENTREIRIHLNNLGFAAQTLLTLFMSLQMELSSLPVMSKQGLRLLSPCSRDAGNIVCIPFNARLHIDFNEQDTTVQNAAGEQHPGKVFINIATAWRTPRAFSLVQCKNDLFVMAYTNQIFKGEEVYVPEHEHVLPPLPLETVAHMNLAKYMRIFIARFHVLYPNAVEALIARGNVQNVLVLAMQLGGRSFHADFMLHIPLELTWSICKEEELPVMTLGSRACIAVMKRRGNTYTLEPTVLRCNLRSPAWLDVLQQHNMPPLATLPLQTQVQWRSDELSAAQSRGVYFSESGEAHMRRPRDPLSHETECVPLVVMPLCQHQALVCVQTGLSEIALWDHTTHETVFVTRIQVRELFSAHEPVRWTLRRSKQWLTEQVDIVPLSKEDDEIYVVELPDNHMQFWVVTANENHGERDRVFFHSRAHLKFVLNANQGLAINASEREVWVHRRWLFGHDSYNSLQTPNIFERMQLGQNKTVACTFVIYNDDEYVQALPAYKQALAHHQQAQHNTGNVSLLQGINKRIQNTRNMLERSKVSSKEWMVLDMPTSTQEETFVLEAAENADREYSLGVLVHHTDAPQWLLDGCYRVSFAFRNNVYSNKIDWATCSMCMVREGHRVYMQLTHDVYKDIRSKLKNAFLPDAALHNAVMTERRSVVLECFYVLGKASRLYYSSFEDLVVDVVILLHRRQREAQEFSFDNKNVEDKFFYQLKVKQNDTMMLSLRPPDELPCVSHLVRKNARDRLQDGAINEEGWDEAAEEHLAHIGPYGASGHGVVYWE